MDLKRVFTVSAGVSLAGAFCTLTLTGAAVAQATGDLEPPKELLAAQVRDQGMTCDSPQSAEKDTLQSAPDEDAWLLHCETATYRVKLVPDMAAEIKKVE
ncbi:hypothetical protein FMN50_01490 [Rhodobacterales bacterium]|nr:hypothetical protein FMN50_01490 [Rhodobacterales bacterium]